MQPEGTPFVYNRKPSCNYQKLTAKDKRGRRLDVIVELLEVLDIKSVMLICGGSAIQLVLDVGDKVIDKYIKDGRAQGVNYELKWLQEED